MKIQFQAVVGVCAALAGGFAAPGTASAQVACSSCGQTGGGCATGNCKSNCGILGLKPYPLAEKRYISQFCHPTIRPDSCFGYYRTQWTAWQHACPNWVNDTTIPPSDLNWGPPGRGDGIPAPVNTGPSRIPPATPDAPAGGKLKDPTPVTPKDTRDLNPAAPQGTIPPQPAAPKPPTAPPAGGLQPKGPLSTGLTLPPVPDLPAAGPARF